MVHFIYLKAEERDRGKHKGSGKGKEGRITVQVAATARVEPSQSPEPVSPSGPPTRVAESQVLEPPSVAFRGTLIGS